MTHKYPPIAAALSILPLQQAYFDGELCGVRPDGKTSFSLIQAASDTGNSDALVFFLFEAKASIAVGTRGDYKTDTRKRDIHADRR
jgi:bifunctional non-homologous end joining protein LigD